MKPNISDGAGGEQEPSAEDGCRQHHKSGPGSVPRLKNEIKGLRAVFFQDPVQNIKTPCYAPAQPINQPENRCTERVCREPSLGNVGESSGIEC